jgi:hypothetical protein
VLLVAAARRLFRECKPHAEDDTKKENKEMNKFDDDLYNVFSTKLWGDNFFEMPAFRMRNMKPDRQKSWMEIFFNGEPVKPKPLPQRADVDDVNKQYAINYGAIYDELTRALKPLADDRLRRAALVQFGTFLRDRVMVLHVHARDFASARMAFNITSIKGEPMDFSIIVRERLILNLKEDGRSQRAG